MVKFENDCCCCDLPCIDCGRKRVPHLYCDKCKSEVEAGELYEYDGDHLCADCLLNVCEKVEVNDYE